MSTNERRGMVLLTGGSCFLARWTIIELLQRGYSVRASLRDPSRQISVRATISRYVQNTDRLLFVQACLSREERRTEAAFGTQYIIHMACPTRADELVGRDIVDITRAGTRRALEAGISAGVTRIVLTSSLAAAMAPAGQLGLLIDEAQWTDLSDAALDDSVRAKTLSEIDAWRFMNSCDSTTTLTTVLPAAIQGPVFGNDNSRSIRPILTLLRKGVRRLPRLGCVVVDVRDLVDLHIRAMEDPRAAGQRFISTGGYLAISDIAMILRQTLGARAAGVPTRETSDFVFE